MERQGASPSLLARAARRPSADLAPLLQIRSMSTYGSLGITSLNVLLFLMSLLLIEPWRRRRLVENVEERCVPFLPPSLLCLSGAR